MKSSLSRLQWIALIGAVAVVLLGGGGVWYLSGLLDQAQAAIDTQAGDLTRLVKRPNFPSQENIDALEQNNRVLEDGLEAATQRLKAPGNKLAESARRTRSSSSSSSPRTSAP